MSAVIAALIADGHLDHSRIYIKKHFVHDFVYFDRRFEDLVSEWGMLDQAYPYECEVEALGEYIKVVESLMKYYCNQVLTNCISSDEHEDRVPLDEIDPSETYEYLCQHSIDDNEEEEVRSSECPDPEVPPQVEPSGPCEWESLEVKDQW